MYHRKRKLMSQECVPVEMKQSPVLPSPPNQAHSNHWPLTLRSTRTRTWLTNQSWCQWVQRSWLTVKVSHFGCLNFFKTINCILNQAITKCVYRYYCIHMQKKTKSLKLSDTKSSWEAILKCQCVFQLINIRCFKCP